MVGMKKPSVYVMAEVIVVFVIVGFAWWTYANANEAWADQSTWSTEGRVVLPMVAENLKVKNTLTKSSLGENQAFEFSTEYCYLYEIAKASDGNSATLKCSLLPMYYAQRSTEVTKTWKESADIMLTIYKNDPEPREFLGRLLTDFESVSTLGGPVKFPVTMAIKGEYKYPQRNIITKFFHLWKALVNQKDRVDVNIISFSVKRLDDATPAEMHVYAQKWLEEQQNATKAAYLGAELNTKIGQTYLDGAKELYQYQRIKCVGLATCRRAYEGNPANNYMYMLMASEKDDPKFFEHSFRVISTSLYPFNNGEIPVSTDAEDSPWKYFSAYDFPICPINDLYSGNKSKSARLIEQYLTKESVIDRSKFSDTYLLSLLDADSYSDQNITGEYLHFGAWEMERVFTVNAACLWAINSAKTTNRQKLIDKVLKVYFSMYSNAVGEKIDGSRANFEKAIYKSNAYSPYKDNRMADAGVARIREGGIQTITDASSEYIEWKSALNTYIMLYIYGSSK